MFHIYTHVNELIYMIDWEARVPCYCYDCGEVEVLPVEIWIRGMSSELCSDVIPMGQTHVVHGT